MRGFGCRYAGEEMRAHLVLEESGIASAPEAAEDLAADGVIPVAEGVAHGAGTSSPGTASEHLVVAAEEGLGVLLVGKALEPGIRLEITGGPFPHVADHPAAADGRDILWIAAHRRGSKAALVYIRQVPGDGVLPP